MRWKVQSLELQGKGVSERFRDHQQEEAINGSLKVNDSSEGEG